MIDLLARYRDGQRDFRGTDLRGARLQNADLCGIDLSGADLRGAHFTGALLQGAKLGGVHCRALLRWVLLRGLLQFGAGILSGLLMTFTSGVLFLTFTEKQHLSWLINIFYIIILMLSLRHWVRKKSIIGAGDGAVVGALGVAAAAALTATVSDSRSVAEAAVATFIYAGVVAVAGSIAGIFIIAGTGAIAIAGAVAVTGAFAVIVRNEPLPAVFTFLGSIVAQLIAAWFLRRRALAGALEHAWVRDFAITVRGLGGTSFRGADLGSADFCGADLRSTDLRGADLDGVCFRDARGLDWARFDAGDLRKLPVQRLLMSGVGAGQDFSGIRFHGLSLRAADFTNSRLQRAELGGADLSAAQLEGALLDKARVDARTYVHSGWTPRMLAKLHERGVEIIALQAFPPEAQDVVVGLRDGLVLSFAQPLTHFRQNLIEGSLYAIVGIESGCRIAEYREKDDGTSFVRIVGADRAELEQVAEAFYRRVWEESRASSSREFARVNELLSDALRQRLSELVRDLVDIELRQPVVAGAGSMALVRRGPQPGAASESVWRWDQRTGRVSFPGQRPRRLVILHSPSDIDTGLCQELLQHMEGLKSQGLLETFHAAPLGEVVAESFAAEIAGSDGVLVLLSAELFADPGCQERLATALRAEAVAQRTLAVPLVLRACDWQSSPLGGRQCLPESRRPVVSWGQSASERDAGWLEVISALRRHLLSLATTR